MSPLFPTPCPFMNASAFVSAMHSVCGRRFTRQQTERRGSHATWTPKSYRSLRDRLPSIQGNLITTV